MSIPQLKSYPRPVPRHRALPMDRVERSGFRAPLRALLCLLSVLFTGVAAAEPALAPPWSLKTPAGDTVNFPQDAKGRPTVLLFWPSWCPFSRALQPYVQDIWNDYRAAGVNVWTINIRETGDPVKAMQERGLSFPLLLKGDDLQGPYGIVRTPWFVVIDGGNRIVYTRPGNSPGPVEDARQARTALNALLGDKAVPLPTSYPAPYDLHLKKKADLIDRRAPVAIPQSEWQPWVEQYLGAIPAGESVAEFAPKGALAKGSDAIALAREVWVARYGAERAHAQAPYRAYRSNGRWIVLGNGLDATLGTGLILVVEADSGRIVRVADCAAKP